MTVTTRSKANQFREEEFTRLRNIDIDDTVALVASSASGQGVHTRWIYPETPINPSPGEFLVSAEQASSSGSWATEGHHSRDEPYRAPTPYWVEPGEMGYITPYNPSPATPSDPQTPTRRFSTGVISDMDMILRVHIKKDEDIGEAVWRHVEMYVEESQKRRLENQRRAYEFVKTQPHLLREVGEGTELFIRECASWDDNPFQ